MVGYWPSSLFAFLWAKTKSRSIKTQKENEAANNSPAILTETSSVKKGFIIILLWHKEH